MTETDLDALLAGLRRPGAWPWPADGLSVVETHISIVLLGGEHALKFKKPVDLGFLDFGSRERRLHFCREELRLNRRTAPALYLDLWFARSQGDGWALVPAADGDGDPGGEPAVHMRRFPDAAQMDRRLTAGHVDGGELEAFGRTLADFHAGLPAAPPGGPYGSPDGIRARALDNLAALTTAPSTAVVLPALDAWTRAAADRLRGRFLARLDGGFVREGHGDLHMANLVYLEERVVAFDGIEFDPCLRWIDVMSDAAFLLMDLESRGRPELGWRFFDAWLERNGDYDGLVLLPWYLVYRHLVRAKVDAIRIGQAGLAAAEYARLEQRLDRHLGLAGGWSGARRPLAVLMTGYSGSGKSHLAARLAPELGAVRVRSDVERKRLHGLAADTDASGGPGTGLYSQGATQRTYARLEAVMRTALGSGLDVVVDAAFLDPDQRARFVDAARSARGTPLWLECTAPVELLFSRVASRHGDASDAGIGILEAQLAAGVAPDGDDAPRRIVDTRERVDASALARSLAALRGPA